MQPPILTRQEATLWLKVSAHSTLVMNTGQNMRILYDAVGGRLLFPKFRTEGVIPHQPLLVSENYSGHPFIWW